jgi:hypothetical protein
MGLRYNPFNGSFDFTRSPGSYLDGEVATFADLPLSAAAAPLNSAWLVREASGLYFLTRKPAGIYIRTATGGTDRNADYTYASAFPDVFSDANFTVYDDADSTKNLQFQLSGITTGQVRTLTVPDASGTLPLLETANTFTQNQTLDGTNNTAPNQTAASGSSVMTRDLVDARAFFQQPWVTFSLTNFSGTGTFNTTGTANGGTVTFPNSALMLQLATTSTTDSTAAAWIDRMLAAGIPHPASGANVVLDFDKPSCLSFAFGVSLSGAANPRAGEFYFNIGQSRSVDAAGSMVRKGFGWLVQDETITAQVHNGTSASNVGTTTSYLAATTDRSVLWLSVYNAGGGNVFFYVNGTQIASTTSGPTGTSTGALLSVQASLLEKSVGVGTGLTVSNLQFAQRL